MSESSSTSIIKSDRTGRTHYSSHYKDEVVAAYEQSGMSGQAFAEQCGVKYPTFAAWVAKSRRRAAAPSLGKANQQFLIAEFSRQDTDSVLKIELPGGAIVHLSSASQARLLGEVLKALA
jgi:transposase-like protein